MTLEELIELYILQRDYHATKKSNDKRISKPLGLFISAPETPIKVIAFEEKINAYLQKHEVEIGHLLAPPLSDCPSQPAIPFLLFKPKVATPADPKPLIIHTHGGPAVYMDERKFHAEITYFVSQGFVVACPNYRGSTGYPIILMNDEHAVLHDPTSWQAWEQNAKDMCWSTGPEDVYAVSKFMQQQPYVDEQKIFLRGGSFGSHINAHLLAAIEAGKFSNIYSGAHLSGGVQYPAASLMPLDFPLLISHSQQDDVAPFDDACAFMKTMLIMQYKKPLDHRRKDTILTVVSRYGDHHLISNTTQLNNKQSPDYLELQQYLHYTTSFITNVCQGKSFIPPALNYFQQLKQLVGVRLPPSETDLINSINAYAYVQNSKVTRVTGTEINVIEERIGELTSISKKKFPTPTMAHLKLILGAHFVNNPAADLRFFLENCFAPLNWDDPTHQEIFTHAGSKILTEPGLFNQLVEIIEAEQQFLSIDDDYMVLYHAAPKQSVLLYVFITLWKAALAGNFSDELKNLEEMRFFDFITHGIDDIDFFQEQMHAKHQPDTLFNNTAGFADYMLSCVISLIGSSHNTSSCSLWWYARCEKGDRTPLDTIFNFLGVAGLNDDFRLNRYLEFFNQEFAPQSLLQQIFLPKRLAMKRAYLCQIWGVEFNKTSDLDLASPACLEEFCSDPVTFEAKLRANPSPFTNPGKIANFGNVDFYYSNEIQVRYNHRSHPGVKINSYLRFPEQFKESVKRLAAFIQEDFASYLANNICIPESVTPGAIATKEKMRKALGIEEPLGVSSHLVLMQQNQLYSGLTQHPLQKTYGDLIRAPTNLKFYIKSQMAPFLFSDRNVKCYIYSVCKHLPGYTYYDLLKELAENLFLNSNLQDKKQGQEDFHFFMNCLDNFDAFTLDSNQPPEVYRSLEHTLQQIQQHFQNDPDKTCAPWMIALSANPYSEKKKQLLKSEIETAIDCVQRYLYVKMKKELREICTPVLSF